MDDHSSLMVDPTNPIPDVEEWRHHRGQFIVPVSEVIEDFVTLPALHAKVIAYLSLMERSALGCSYFSEMFLSSRLQIPLTTLQRVLQDLTGPESYLESITFEGRVGYRFYIEYTPEEIAHWREMLAYKQGKREPVRPRVVDPNALPSKTKRESKKLVQRFAMTCVYCKRVGTGEKDPDGQTWHRDHVWAKSQGGGLGANIVLACRQCNTRKHSMAATEFLEMLKAEGTLKAAD